MNKVNYLALGAVGLIVISVLSPWVEVSISGGSDLNETSQLITVSGISIGYGIFGLLVALLGGVLAYKEYRWAFLAGIINFIDGYGYLHRWFGTGTHDSANYGDVTSRSSVDPKFGLYLFIVASLAFMFFTLKYYKSKKAKAVSPAKPDMKENKQPVYRTENTVSSPVYKPSKTETMSTVSSEIPTEPVPSETPKVPAPSAETPAEETIVTPTVTEPVVETPTEPAKPIETPKEPVQAVVTEPEPVINQAPRVAAAPQQPVVEPERKKSSTAKVLLIILAIVLVGSGVFYMTYNTSLKSKDKTEQSVNDEKARLEAVINEVNQLVSDKKYDDALLKVNSINWLFEPDANKGYVDQYNSQRENLRNTISQMKSSQSLEDQNKATQKANEVTTQPTESTDSIH